MSESQRQLLTIGVFLIIIVVAILLVATKVLAWTLFVPLVLVLCGVWMLVLSLMRSMSPHRYARSAFSTLAFGVALMVVGGAWYLFAFNWLYSLALMLLAIGAIAIVAALRRTK
jgi:hypothetical protein